MNSIMTNNEKKRRKQWDDQEVFELAKLWKNCASDIRKIKRNGHLYADMALSLSARGIHVSASEVHIKVNNLTQRYRQEMKSYEASGIASTWKFFDVTKTILDNLDGNMYSPGGFHYNRSPQSCGVPKLEENDFSCQSEEIFCKTEMNMSGNSNEHNDYSQVHNNPPVYSEPNPNSNFVSNTNMNVPDCGLKEPPIYPTNVNSDESQRFKRPIEAEENNDYTNDRGDKRRKTDEYNELTAMIKNLMESNRSENNKIDTFCGFIKSYMKEWPERVQDEAVNHITNYIIVKNMDYCSSSGNTRRK